VVVTLSSVGLPGTNGFVGEFLILSGTWLGRLHRAPVYAALGATGVILSAVYMLFLVEKVFFGPMRNLANRHLSDMSLREGLVVAPLFVLIVAMGLAPSPFLEPAKPAVDRLLARFQAAEQRLRRENPSLPPQVGTDAPAVALAPPAGAPGGAAPAAARGSH
jgi:NADH-quinone oxidoreductase subunit M